MANILVVDDESDVLDTLVGALAARGHAVKSAANGVEALDIIDSGAPLDLLLTDVIMPGLNGFNLARMVRSRRPNLAILYLTGFFEQATTMKDSGEKYGRLLTKPIGPVDLAREVDVSLGLA
jgi:CheY-like chemotaxis protein